MWLNVALDNINKFTKFISDESKYEAEYAYGSEIYDDFLFSVGRKRQILNSAIKVKAIFNSFFIICISHRFGPV